ncbi:MAG: type II toxin-antitoxin system HipA family toxin [Oscillospiraceae bacterium]|nr:type II toxin-antitoxin system HipA family toxin [Oscillospiraceae bacterium]
METYKMLNVHIDDRQVGTLAMYQGRFVAFEYADAWLADGFSISPFALPLIKKLFMPKYDPFDGLFGVFADSLPDGWGRLLVDRMLAKEGTAPNKIDAITRLAIVGKSGMGALTYLPAHKWQITEDTYEYDRLARECTKILQSEYSDDLDELFRLGGSSGGARPKILTKIDGEDWIVKFHAGLDRKDSGEIEYRYSRCAKKCGITMSETRLFPSAQCAGYFGTKRFDRQKLKDGKTKRTHMLSVSALLEISHRLPALDYNSLMKLTLELTKDYSEVEKMYRLMCFNVFAHNRDDHSNNFSFLYDEASHQWKLSPAYDLTYSYSLGGEHATCINGNGLNPSTKDLLAVAEHIGLNKAKATEVAQLVEQTVQEELGSFGNRVLLRLKC